MSVCLERMSGCNYYQLLGLDATATDSEIRRAYLRLSLQWHPDKRRDSAFPPEECDNIFRSIQEAYETLSCPEKRCLYDFVGAFAALADATVSSLPRPVPTPSSATGQQHAAASSQGVGSSADAPRHLAAASASPCPSHSSPSPSSDTCLSTSPGATRRGLGGSAALGGLEMMWSDVSGGSSTIAVSLRDMPQTWQHLNLQHHKVQHSKPQPQQPQQGATEVPAAAAAPLGTSHVAAAAIFLHVPLPAPDGPCPYLTITSPASPGSLLGKRRTPSLDAVQPQPHTAFLDAEPGPQPPPPRPWPQSRPPGLEPCRPLQSPQTAGDPLSALPSPSGTGLGASGGVRQTASADVYHKLLLTLEEMYSGCMKQLRLARRVYRPPPEAAPCSAATAPVGGGSAGAFAWGGTAGGGVIAAVSGGGGGGAGGGLCWRVEELFRVVVQPGWREGTKVTFRGKGDELPCGSAGDMVLVVAQAAHGRYERRGHDLYTVVVVPLVDALTGGDAAITTLDGRTLVLQIGPTCLQPCSERVVKGEGMPIPPGRGRGRDGAGAPGGTGAAATAGAGAGAGAAYDPGCVGVTAGQARGDLHVRFEVCFPPDLTSEQKEELRLALGGGGGAQGDGGGPGL